MATLLAVACEQKPECNVDLVVRTNNDRMLASFDSISNMKLFWRRVSEPELKGYRRDAFRLTIVDTWNRRTEIYRLEKREDRYLYIAKKYKPIPGNLQKDSLVWSFEENITENDWDAFITQSQQFNYWNWPVRIKREKKDGKSWVFEASKPDADNCTNRSYHLVSRWEPEDSTEIRILGDALMAFKPQKGKGK